MKCIFHKWKKDQETDVRCNRTCTKCSKEEHSIYDMTYGKIYWVDGLYW